MQVHMPYMQGMYVMEAANFSGTTPFSGEYCKADLKI